MDCGVLDCDNNEQTPEQLFRQLVRVGSDGCPALSLAAVEGPEVCTPFFSCPAPGAVVPELSWKQLFMALTALNQNGCISVPTIVTGANCALQALDHGLIHCLEVSLLLVNPFGDMTYLSYYYIHEYSTNGGATWTAFGGNLNIQSIEVLPGWETPELYIFRTRVACSAADTYFRTFYYSGALAAFPYRRFMQVKINGGPPVILKRASQGVNYFCEGTSLEFIQPNTNYGYVVTGADTWSNVSKVYADAILMPDGSYNVALTDLTADACDGAKDFNVEIIKAPVLTDKISLCPSSSVTIDAGAGYNTYLWSTGETTRTISVNTPGTYSVTVTHSGTGGGCTLTSNICTVALVTLPAISIQVQGGPNICYPLTGLNEWTMVAGDFFFLEATEGWTTYDWGQGSGPGVDNTQIINGTTPGVLTVTFQGCSVDIPYNVLATESNIIATLAQTGGPGVCNFAFDITDPSVIQANVVINAYGLPSGTLIQTVSNVLSTTFALPVGDTQAAVEVVLAPGTDGCNKGGLIFKDCI